MNKLKSQKGSFSLGELIFLAVIGISIYIGIMMATPWVRFYQVQELFKNEVIRLKVAPEEEVREAINKKLTELEVPLSIDDVQIIREEGKAPVIEGTYQVDVQFIGGYKYTYIFKPRGEAPKSAGYS
ncbi:MAG: hypothetical protein Q7T53_05325 [Deltaproteobacteria bacterium]|nr:hypothetical protein [Deltaproteobacteria bacterium]